MSTSRKTELVRGLIVVDDRLFSTLSLESAAAWPASWSHARSNLLSNLLDEGLGAHAVARFVFHDLANEPRLDLGCAGRAIANLGRELPALEGYRPLRLLDDLDPVRLAVVRRLRLGHIVEAGRLDLSARTVTARARRGEPE